jgi:predicted Zn-dependent protease
MILLLVSVLFFSNGCQKLRDIKDSVLNETTEDRALEKGISLEKSGKYKEALELYENYNKSLKKNGEVPSRKVEMFYARALFKYKKDKNACVIIENLSKDDSTGCLEKLLADCYMETNQYKKSEKTNKSLMKKFPGESSKYLNAIGESLKEQGEVVKAQSFYKKALLKNPVNATEIKGNLAQALSQAGQDKKALSMLKSLGTKSDASDKIKMQLAESYTLSGNKEEAKGVLSGLLKGNNIKEKMKNFISRSPWN